MLASSAFRLAARKSTTGLCRCQARAHQGDHQLGREAVRRQQRIGGAVRAPGQQLQQAALIGGHWVALHASYSARNATLAASSVGACP
jgi:hypothetical protein